MKMISDNRKARFNYFIKDTFEAGVALEGWEVKSARAGEVSLDESFVHAVHIDGTGGRDKWELILKNAYFAPYTEGDTKSQNTKRNRKLLLKRSEIDKIAKAVQIKGAACVATKLYITKGGLVKAEIAIAAGKDKIDKRRALKERDIARETKKII